MIKCPYAVIYEGDQDLEDLQSIVLPLLDAEEVQEWKTAAAQAKAEGTFFMVYWYHCAVGTKGF